MCAILGAMLIDGSASGAISIDHGTLSGGGDFAVSGTFTTFGLIGEPLTGVAVGAVHQISAGFLACALQAPLVAADPDLPTALPRNTGLRTAGPNPAIHQATISFDMATPGHVSVRIHDSAGRLVRDLADELYEPGRYSVSWDCRDTQGALVGAGVYFWHFLTAGVRETRRLVVLR